MYDRALRAGVATLSPTDHQLYLVQDFIIEFEMNGLSGYLYNRILTPGQIRSTVEAMNRFRLTAPAGILQEMLDLFIDYVPDEHEKWSDVLHRCDPSNRLEELSKRIDALGNYGLDDSIIE